MQSIAECQLDPQRGERWFNIVEGDIADSEADAVVISASAHSWQPVGSAAIAIQAKHGDKVFENQRQMLAFSPTGFFSLGPEGTERGGYAGIP